jgi:hypothetical protein
VSEPKSPISRTRIIVWILVGGAGLYLVISGLVGIITKSQ